MKKSLKASRKKISSPLLKSIRKGDKFHRVLIDASVFVSGLLLAFAFAPYNQFWLMFILLAWVMLCMVDQTPGKAFWRGWLFGLGAFVHGIHWIYYSLHYHGGTPFILASALVVLLSAYLALFPALAFYIARKWFPVSIEKQLLLLFPASWLLMEWLRGYLFTGFPWLQLGYAQIDTPLAGYGPLIGGLGIGGLTLLSAGLLAMLMLKKKILYSLIGLSGIWLLGFVLLQFNWTTPVDRLIKVSLIQGNIAQSDKWKPQMHGPTLRMYHELTKQHWDSDLIIWPETAIPDFKHRVGNYLQQLKNEAEINGKDVLLGLFIRDPDTSRYYNSVISVRDGEYLKRHLVPLGEYFPLRGLLSFFMRWIDIPMSDVDSGPEQQSLVTAAGQPLGISICFEDAFDRDIRKDLPQATLLVNVSNDAWFEDSPEAWQHHQIARMRALESGRFMLRATNTGVSSVIDARGEVVAISPQFKRHELMTLVQPMQGSTLYSIAGNFITVILACLLLLFLVFDLRTSSRT